MKKIQNFIKQYQYHRCNNLELQEIPDSVVEIRLVLKSIQMTLKTANACAVIKIKMLLVPVNGSLRSQSEFAKLDAMHTSVIYVP